MWGVTTADGITRKSQHPSRGCSLEATLFGSLLGILHGANMKARPQYPRVLMFSP